MFELTENKLILKVENETVGYIIYDLQPDHLIGTYIYVDPNERGKNYANILLVKFVEMAKEKNMKINPICHVMNRMLNEKYPEMVK